MFLNNPPTNDQVKQHAASFRIKNYQQIREKYYLKRCEAAAVETGTDLCIRQHDAEKIFNLISRAEPSQKKHLITTVSAFSKTRAGSSENMKEILDESPRLPITGVIEKMQEVGLLNPDNTDKTLGAKTAIEYVKDLERAGQRIMAQLGSGYVLFGEERKRASNIAQNLARKCAEQIRIWSEG